jgi:hypothetical protein
MMNFVEIRSRYPDEFVPFIMTAGSQHSEAAYLGEWRP